MFKGLQFDLFLFLVSFSYELWQIGGSFEKKVQSGTLIRFYISLNWGEKWFLPSKKLKLCIFKVADFGDIALCSTERRVV